jgi:nicotinamidase-related amidase
MDTNEFEALAALKNQDTFSLSPARSALLVVDMQRYFVEPDFPFGQVLTKVEPAEAAAYFTRVRSTVVPNLQDALKCCRKLGIPSYFTAFGSLRDDGRDLPGWARQLNTLSRRVIGAPMYPPRTDPSWQIHESLVPAQGEQVVAKTTSGLLNSTRLDQTFHCLGIDTAIIGGGHNRRLRHPDSPRVRRSRVHCRYSGGRLRRPTRRSTPGCLGDFRSGVWAGLLDSGGFGGPGSPRFTRRPTGRRTRRRCTPQVIAKSLDLATG